jgi:hypothetical protein
LNQRLYCCRKTENKERKTPLAEKKTRDLDGRIKCTGHIKN